MKNSTQINPYIQKLTDISCKNNNIISDMYIENNVKRGLRDENGNGVITGLTEISDVISRKKLPDGSIVPCEGELYYRGVNIKDFTADFLEDDRFGFEEAVYLLLFSELPKKEELEDFKKLIADYRSLPPSFVRDMILKAPGKDLMNILARSVLALYSYDDNPDDVSIENVLRQCLQLIAMFPLLAVYGYHGYRHYHLDKNLYIRKPIPELSTSENLLNMLRKDGKFSHLEAKVLDLALVLHAEHGGGNNSSFTTHVVTSSGTDTYSAIAAALGSLKGPRHGGANTKVVQMFDDMKNNINVMQDSLGMLSMVLKGGMLDLVLFELSKKLNTYIAEHGQEKAMPAIRSQIEELSSWPLYELSGKIDEDILRRVLKVAYSGLVTAFIDSVAGNVDIAIVVEEKVNAMSVKDVESLCMSVMKNELDAVVNLGAVIGFVIGILNVVI